MNQPIQFYSTNLKAPEVTFKEALLKGMAYDKGLYTPKTIPAFAAGELDSFVDMEYHEIAYAVCSKLLAGQIGDDELKALVKEAYNFPVPLEQMNDNRYLMRLDQGPTASFKDFAARMMGRLMQYYLKQNGQELLILTATSGDTGGAMANAFYGLDHVNIVVLFPKDEVTLRQRKQMTTLGKNVQAIALDAKFDDCQAMVKKAFADNDLNYLNLSSANSINIGRLIPQIVYYVYAYAKLRKTSHDSIVFSVPSGNFGDMMGCVIAKKMGLPVSKLIVPTNDNDEFPRFLETGKYKKIEPSKNCISSAMNVGHPSNLVRLVALYGGVMDEVGNIIKPADMEQMRKDIFSVSVSDEQTKQVIKDVYGKFNVLLEPHGAVACKGLFDYETAVGYDSNQLSVCLETAHPAKFPEHIQNILGIDPALPASMEGLESQEESFLTMGADYEKFKTFLKENY